MVIRECLEIIKQGRNINFEQAYQLATKANGAELFDAADSIRKILHGEHFDLCSIINAKSGKCSENCRFCAQSSYYNTEIERYDIVDEEAALLQGKDNDEHGVARFSLVTAGKSSTINELKRYGEIYTLLSEQTQMKFCASMGMLTLEKAKLLKSYGVERYHCNLEACRAFFPKVCTSHTWEEKVETIKSSPYNFKHHFEQPGSYTLNVEFTDKNGVKNSSRVQLEVL